MESLTELTARFRDEAERRLASLESELAHLSPGKGSESERQAIQSACKELSDLIRHVKVGKL